MKQRGFILLLLWTLVSLCQAAPVEPKPFVQGSMREVARSHAGKHFILAFWSLSCVHCKANLELFGKLVKQHPQLPLVLVSTDSPEENTAIVATLEKYGLEELQTWVFADRFVERLYFEIDRRWRGELPRTYLYEATHQARTLTGRLDEAETRLWVQTLPGR